MVCDQQFLANQMGVSTRTIRRWLDYLEEKGALVRIPVAGKVCAYALDPHEVWKGYNTSKNYSAFVTKTLVNKDGEIKTPDNGYVFRRGEQSKASSEATLDGSGHSPPSEGGWFATASHPHNKHRPLSSRSHK